MWDIVAHQFATNQFLSGGFVIATFGAALALFRKLPAELWWRLQGQLVVSVDILGTDPVFDWVRVWLSRHTYTQRSRLLTASARARGDGDGPSGHAQQLIFTPAPGSHFLRYRGSLVWIRRVRKGVESSLTIWRESFTILILGRDPLVARSLIEEARECFLSDVDDRTLVFRSVWDRWTQANRIIPRVLDSVILADDAAMSTLAADLQWFFDAEPWYQARGIPYRRGYLFEGVPGSGKSSAILSLAGHCRRNIYMLSLSGRGISDQRLQDLLFQVPYTGIVVLEDIDAAFNGRQAADPDDESLTFSGLLNAIDGIGAPEGRVIFMTTNHIDRIDPALIRPGRIDVRLTFGTATTSQVKRLFQRFHPDATNSDADAFAASVSTTVTMADVQGLLLQRPTTS